MPQYKHLASSRKSPQDPIVRQFGRRAKLTQQVVHHLWQQLARPRNQAQQRRTAETLSSWRNALFAQTDGSVSPTPFEVKRKDEAIRRAWRSKWSWLKDEEAELKSAADTDYVLCAVHGYFYFVLRAMAAQAFEVRASGKFLAGMPWFDEQSLQAYGWSGFETEIFDPLLPTLTEADEWAYKVGCHAGEVVQQWPRIGARDRFRSLYEDLVPRLVRQRLGEFYTPDWLVDWTLDRVDARFTDDKTPMLDPACGSGSFLVAGLSRWLGHHGDTRIEFRIDRRTNQLQLPVFGIDLNPLAVCAARTNLLLTLLPHLELDSMASANWQLPVVQGDSILSDGNPTDDQARRLNDLPTRRFPLVVGNPPWVGWESLSASYREQTASLWHRYGLFAHQGMDTILGKGRKDLSMLMSYAVSDRFLQSNGRLAFVVTQAALFNPGAGEGFRRLQLSDQPADSLKLLFIDDFSEIQPFPAAATSTIVIGWQKGQPTTFPVSMARWKPARSSTETAMYREDDGQQNASRQQQASLVLETGTGETLAAEEYWVRPLKESEASSTWMWYRQSDGDLIPRLVRPSPYRAYEGVNSGGANGIYWLKKISVDKDGNWRVRNCPEYGKRTVPATEAVIEPNHLYPLVRGTQLTRWSATSDTYLLLLQDPSKRQGWSVEQLRQQAPLTWQYIRRFQAQLRERAAYRRFFAGKRNLPGQSATDERAPFYSMFNVGGYSLAPFKVAWHRMVKPIQATVLESIQDRPILPQETHAFIPLASRAEACYLAAMLNSQTFAGVAQATALSTGKGFGSPHLLERAFIPLFDNNNSIHRQVATQADSLPQTYDKTTSTNASSHDSWPDGHIRETIISALEPLTREAFATAVAQDEHD